MRDPLSPDQPDAARQHDPDGAAAAAKAALRARVRAARRARTDGERAEAAGALARTATGAPALADLPSGAVVAAYRSSPSEPGTGPLRAALRARGLRVLLPVVPPAPGPLAWAWDGEPAPGHPDLRAAAVVLLPALAVDATGARLGQGGGHYDRTLAPRTEPGARGPLLVAVLHEEELLPAGAVPREAHDVRVHAVLTPRRWVDLLVPSPAP